MTDNFINISGYKFVKTPAEQLYEIRSQIKEKAESLSLKGTVLLGIEGINAFMSGGRAEIDAFVSYLQTISFYNDISFKESVSTERAFNKLIIRIKNEIVTMGHAEINPAEKTAPYLEPDELKQWYDEGRDFVILDTRNNYEFALGTFDEAIELNIESFREFPDAVAELPDEVKQKPVVTFCTGGIRCEKAAELMQQKGFKEVYQLQGGILNYFEKIGGDHYHGDCFVFDKRLTVDANLTPTQTLSCYEHASKGEVSNDCPYCQHIQTSRETERQA